MIQSNKTILITGGSSGIGLALAEKFLSNNNIVVVVGRDISKLQSLKENKPNIHVFQCDITIEGEVKNLAKQVQEEFGGIDVLINNAGIMNLIDSGNEDNDLKIQYSEIDINFKSPIRMLHYFLPQLKKSKEGVLINVSSGLAYVPFSQAPVYSGTKAAMHFWTRSIRLQLAVHNIKVIELLPPVVDTPLAVAANISESSLKPMKAEKLADLFWSGYSKGVEEIVPGISSQLKFFSRFAPKFIFGQLNK